MINILKKNLNEDNQFLMKKYSMMKWYPIFQVIYMIPSTINRIYTLLTKQHIFVMSMLQSIFDSSLGITICIIFLLSPEIKNSLIACFKKMTKSQTEKAYSNTISDSFIENNTDENFNYFDQSKRTSSLI